MARAYGDTASQQFQTFEDQRYSREEPVETARYLAETQTRPPQENWWQDDAYQRSDVVLESNTDPTGWQAGAVAPAVDDRPPAESHSGNRLLTVILFFAGLATSVALWLFETPAGTVNDTSTSTGVEP